MLFNPKHTFKGEYPIQLNWKFWFIIVRIASYVLHSEESGCSSHRYHLHAKAECLLAKI